MMLVPAAVALLLLLIQSSQIESVRPKQWV